MPESDRDTLLILNQKLLDSIDQQDWDTYTQLCDPTLTAFETEAVGHLVEGMAFHAFYFDHEKAHMSQQSIMSSAHVRLMGDVAVVSYVRLIQRLDTERHSTTSYEETRVWQQQNGAWKHVHFHRTKVGHIRL